MSKFLNDRVQILQRMPRPSRALRGRVSRVCARRASRLLCAAIGPAFVLLGFLQAQSLPDAGTIIRRSLDANARNFQALPDYNYFKVEQRKGGRSQTYEEIMILGSRYPRLVAIDGKPLSAARAEEEARRLERTRQERARESSSERTRRVGQYERERQRDQAVLSEMAKAFNFKLIGEGQLDSHEVYILRATPRRGYKAPSGRVKVLTGMEGTLWIDKSTLQWVRVHAEVIRPVAIEGLLARVEPGTAFEMDQMPVAEGLWFPRRFSMRAKARIFLLFSSQSEENESYYGYYRASAATLP